MDVLTFDEQTNLIKQGVCFFYRKKGDMACDCPLKRTTLIQGIPTILGSPSFYPQNRVMPMTSFYNPYMMIQQQIPAATVMTLQATVPIQIVQTSKIDEVSQKIRALTVSLSDEEHEEFEKKMNVEMGF